MVSGIKHHLDDLILIPCLFWWSLVHAREALVQPAVAGCDLVSNVGVFSQFNLDFLCKGIERLQWVTPLLPFESITSRTFFASATGVNGF